VAKAGRGEESVDGAMSGACGGRLRTFGVAQAPTVRSEARTIARFMGKSELL
jgi:hypothetical protein